LWREFQTEFCQTKRSELSIQFCIYTNWNNNITWTNITHNKAIVVVIRIQMAAILISNMAATQYHIFPHQCISWSITCIFMSNTWHSKSNRSPDITETNINIIYRNFKGDSLLGNSNCEAKSKIIFVRRAVLNSAYNSASEKKTCVSFGTKCLFSNMPKIWTTIWCAEIRTILQVDHII